MRKCILCGRTRFDRDLEVIMEGVEVAGEVMIACKDKDACDEALIEKIRQGSLEDKLDYIACATNEDPEEILNNVISDLFEEIVNMQRTPQDLEEGEEEDVEDLPF